MGRKKIFVRVIHCSYLYFKILNKNIRVYTLSLTFYVFFLAQSFAEADVNEKHFTVHLQYCNKQSTLYEQVDALETERTEENQGTKKQNLT